MLNRVYWIACTIGLIAIIALCGLIYHEWSSQVPLATPCVQESFTLPVTDKSYSEMAVVGPESEIDNG